MTCIKGHWALIEAGRSEVWSDHELCVHFLQRMLPYLIVCFTTRNNACSLRAKWILHSSLWALFTRCTLETIRDRILGLFDCTFSTYSGYVMNYFRIKSFIDQWKIFYSWWTLDILKIIYHQSFISTGSGRMYVYCIKLFTTNLIYQQAMEGWCILYKIHICYIALSTCLHLSYK